jgi:hypothetical protein
LLDLLSELPLRGPPRDLRLGSGLTANRINLPYASELYLAFNISSSFASTSALLIDPCSPSFSPRGEKVTVLEPRTPHQPEKLKKLSKNNPVLLLLDFQSTKNTAL